MIYISNAIIYINNRKMLHSMRVWLGLFAVLLQFICCKALVEECPHPEDNYPCYCEEDEDRSNMHLHGNTKNHIASNAFKGPEIKEIVFTNSTVKLNAPQFVGQELALGRVTLTACFDKDNLMESWSLSHLENLKEMSFVKNVIKVLDNDWITSSGSSFRSLTFDNCQIESLGDKVFSKLTKLTTVYLPNNRISVISRSMFSKPAENLRSISLNGNEIQVIPEDFFKDMPSLRVLELEKNNLKTISESTWGFIIEDLSRVYLEGNPIRCDSNIKWISKRGLPKTFTGHCKKYLIAFKILPRKSEMLAKTSKWSFLAIFAWLCQVTHSNFVTECPHPEDSYPCYCEDDDNISTMHCNHLTESKQFSQALSHLKKHKLDSLSIWMYDLEKFKSDAFMGPAITEITFSHSTVNIEHPQFAGQEKYLSRVTFLSCFDEEDFVNSWSLGHMTNLKEISFEKNDIQVLKNDWLTSSGPSLRSVTFDNCKIEKLEDKVFAGMTKLTTIFLMDNKITSLTRSMFPRPAESLRSISMSDNRIEYLSDDIFEDMPSLLTVELERNNLKTLKEEVWSAKLNEFNRVFLEGNLFVCNGTLKWITNVALPKTFVGSCFEPGHLKDKSLSNLTPSDF
ncbi:hypothetical protein JTE90_021868 [Oedothorax gibbosus]|uniref:Toll-like receptor 1 n=1 Tax=Oedothorax gibbosus TaxID=931172 RepID=A0AAV6V0S2_9ARAC|nr:hypothetical protein JTE90_021868 [Oedothorax gibbosus]